MNQKIARLIGWAPPAIEAAPRWAARQLLQVAETFIRNQPERLDPATLRLESITGDEVAFAIDGYAADRESTHVFNATVRGHYNVTTDTITRVDG